MTIRTLYLKKKEEIRIKSGHLWVFSNEVDVEKSPLHVFAPGDEAIILSSSGRELGIGYVNPSTLICARLCDPDPSLRLDREFVCNRISAALALRESIYAKPYYRLVFSEADYLPGLVADRFGEVLVLQLNTSGVERLRNEIIDVFKELINPSCIVLRNDTRSRALEGLPSMVETVFGDPGEDLRIEEGQARFTAPLLGGQKTGWFFDQSANRLALSGMVKGKRVLDVYSYVGALAVGALKAGAASVTCIDSSAKACTYVKRNAEANGVAENIEIIEAEAFKALDKLLAEGRRFDVVSLDPPAFVQRKKDLESGRRAYLKLNRQGMRLLADDGILLASSCSQHLPAQDLGKLVCRAARENGRRLQMLASWRQGPDHPVHPAMPETEYLKACLVRAVKTGEHVKESE